MRNIAVRMPLLALTLLALPACEVKSPVEGVKITLNVTNAPVNLSAGSVSVLAGQLTQTSTTVSFTETVSGVNSVSSIALQPSYFSFSAAAGGAGSSTSGSMDGTLFVGLERVEGGTATPLLSATLTITNNVVTAVSPATADLESMAATIRANAAAVIAGDPSQAARFSGWTSMTATALLAEIEDVLTSNQSTLRVIVKPMSGNLNGSLTMSQFSLSAQLTKET